MSSHGDLKAMAAALAAADAAAAEGGGPGESSPASADSFVRVAVTGGGVDVGGVDTLGRAGGGDGEELLGLSGAGAAFGALMGTEPVTADDLLLGEGEEQVVFSKEEGGNLGGHGGGGAGGGARLGTADVETSFGVFGAAGPEERGGFLSELGGRLNGSGEDAGRLNGSGEGAGGGRAGGLGMGTPGLFGTMEVGGRTRGGVGADGLERGAGGAFRVPERTTEDGPNGPDFKLAPETLAAEVEGREAELGTAPFTPAAAGRGEGWLGGLISKVREDEVEER